jgi:hypothetical protein
VAAALAALRLASCSWWKIYGFLRSPQTARKVLIPASILNGDCRPKQNFRFG